ncbi:acetoacetyl-CoA synthetase [Desulfocucumis palustris]|uniref:Acetoacetyl-CoA synthetase n=1 Tax=Desulfocucumis palustris TaxID=1898651 RepID=A0A2L2XIV6_9FIRM|nr:acetoacetate--CoA ligase [Desulfocucumis palustris]GBF33851.1 acetoacetyl-CoA synthetase [Desulfocucumis palustris]
MGALLWKPSEEQIKEANMTRYINFVNEKYGLSLSEYSRLYHWSIENIPDFWASVWDYCDVIFSAPYRQVVNSPDNMLEARWFAGARLNFAQNLLRHRDSHTALVFRNESGDAVRITHAGLYNQVARAAKTLRDMGVKAGDRVAGFMPNMIETVVAMLAAASIGAIWSSCSPDFGTKGVLDRFGQIGPRVLFTTDGYYYGGKKHDSIGRIAGFLKDIPSIAKVVVVPYAESNPDIGSLPGAVYYNDFLAPEEGLEIEFEQLPFNHPLYIMYSSGTTGVPKCIVHGAGGTLLQHLKELILHTDLKRNDTIFYFTTCGWMMWNWLVSSLAVGAAAVLYDGSPFYPDPGALFKMAAEEGVTVFGTSAKYLAAVEKADVSPGRDHHLGKLRAVLSTGSPLPVESFEYVYREIKQDLCLSSISGGTDIISCFALGNPTGPVYAGELQCRGLGMKVEAFDETGSPVLEKKGELVCTAPFPSMPVGFWDDPDNKKYRSAYFEVYPNVWRHGDYIEITPGGGVIIYGRSDATLNPGGVRIGTAEIYRQVETLPEILDSLVVGQDWDNDVRVILFVKLAEGVELDDGLTGSIKKAIRENTTPRHVPAKIIRIKDIPYTINGKKVELAVRNIIHNLPVKNQDALANPEALEFYRNLPELQN